MDNNQDIAQPTEMSGDIVSPQAPAFWEKYCREHNSLFNSQAWQEVIFKGFGVKTLYLWHAATQSAAAISIFRAGPFRIGYVGFPTGSVIGNAAAIHELMRMLAVPLSLPPIDVLRWYCSAFKPISSLPYRHEILPETALTDLQQWSDSVLPKRVNRDVRKARRSRLIVVEADKPDYHGECMYNLYAQAIIRHRGRIRYTLPYFRELVRLAASSPQMYCLLAMHNEKVAAFLVLAIEGDTAYYLHGANDRELSRLCPSDLLLYHAIHEAKALGLSCFNLMASPQNQPSLVRFKEKWGSVTKPQTTYDIPLRPTAAKLFYTGYSLYKFLRRK